MAGALLFVEAVIFSVGFKYIFGRDRFFGLFFLALGIYAIPAQIGYLYFSDLSDLMQAYFGEEVWYPATVFILLSLAFFWLLFALFRRPILRSIPISVRVVKCRKAKMRALGAIVIVSGFILYELIYLVMNYGDISWYTAQDEELTRGSAGYFLFIFIFKIMVAISITLYALMRQRVFVLSARFLKVFFGIAFIIFTVISVRLGNRTDLLALVLGIAVFESSQIKFTPRAILKACIASAGVIFVLTLVELARYEADPESSGLAAALLAKDYYAPAHMLFAVIAYKFVDPAEVLVSNTSNALVLLNYPYLQGTITELFRPGLATRSAGYAFYVLTEGYVFLGMAGFLYNGAMLMLGMSLWKRLASTNSKNFNLFVLGIMGCMVVNLVRGQTSYFIKYLYTLVVPGIILYSALSGVRLRFILRFRWGSVAKNLGSAKIHEIVESRPYG